MVAERTRDYELVLVLSPEATEDEVNTTVERITGLITERGGSVSDPEIWGVRRLAYPVQKFQEGNYVLARFSTDAKEVVELDRNLNAAQDVLRHLVTKADKSVRKKAALEESRREKAALEESRQGVE